MTKSAKTAKITKEQYNYLKDNRELAKKVIKAIEKRERQDLPVRIEGSSDLSQSAVVKVDLTGMKPTVGEGEVAIRDLTVKKRKPTVIAQQAEEQSQEDDSDHDGGVYRSQESSQFQEERGADIEDGLVSNQSDQSSQRSDLAIQLPERLSSIVDALYDCVNSPTFTRHVTQTPSLELSEFTFHPLSSDDSESLHLASIKKHFELTERTRSSSERSYSLRCYNTFLVKSALVEKIMENDPTKSEAQVVYSLKDKLMAFDINFNRENFKTCCSRGKALTDFMKELDLDTYCKLYIVVLSTYSI